MAIINGGKVQLISRNQKDLSKRFPVIVEALQKLPVKSAVLDGEVVVLDEQGRPSFQDLQYFDPKLASRLFYCQRAVKTGHDRALQNQPLVGSSKPASLRRRFSYHFA